MKRIHLFSAIIVIMILAGCASPSLSQVFIGLKAGPGYSNFGLNPTGGIRIYYEGFFNDEPALFTRHGFVGGAFILFCLRPHLSLQTEILYAKKGSGGGLGPRTEWMLDYLEIPVLIRADVSVARSTSFFILGGFESDVNINSKYRIYNSAGKSFDFNIGNVKTFDWGAVAGGGISHLFKKVILSLELRYVFGLNSLVDSGTTFTDSSDTIYLANPGLEARNRQLTIFGSVAIEI